MNNYPIVIIGNNLKNTQAICSDFVENNSIKTVKRFGQCKFKIETDENEYWIMLEDDYVQWCKGRTYYLDGKLMHSNYELKEQK